MDGDPDLGILLTLAVRGFVDSLHAELRVRGFADLRPPYGVVFRALRDKPLTLTELAARLGVTKQSAAKVVNEMEAKKFLRRKGSPTDGRAKTLELTARGREAMATAIAIGGELTAAAARRRRDRRRSRRCTEGSPRSSRCPG